MKPRHRPLRPPVLELDADVRWVLWAAFARERSQCTRPSSPSRAAHLVEQFSLTNPVVSRLSHVELVDALEPERAAALTQRFRVRIMRSLAVTQTRQRVCSAATEARVEIALLKNAALEAAGAITPQQRYATDVDILIQPGHLDLFCAALKARGFSLETNKHHAHGVPVLRSENGIGVELHTQILDLAFSGGCPVTFASAKERGCLQELNPDTPFVSTPAREVVAAHIIAQGWYLFHYVPNAPAHKSPFRLMSDMALLKLHENAHLTQSAFALIAHRVASDECAGLLELIRGLEDGPIDDLPNEPARLLRHAIASQLDASYRQRLVIVHQIATVRHEGLRTYISRQAQRIWSNPKALTGAAATEARWMVVKELVHKATRGLLATVREIVERSSARPRDR